MANISGSYNKYHVFQGPCIVYLGAAGTTPDTIGAVANVGIEVGLELERLEQGFPRITQELYVKRKTAKVHFDTLEVGDYPMLRYAFGSSFLSTAPGGPEVTHKIYFGEQSTLNTCSIMLQIVNVEGITETVCIWKALATDGFSKTYDDESIHKPTLTFEVLRSTLDWAGDPTDYDDGEYVHGELMKLTVQGANLDTTL